MKKECGIYIHIPFCKKKCNYCDFLSFACNEDIIFNYINSLKEEILFKKEKLCDYTIKTVYIGGGTPSLIDEKYIKDILDTIYNCLNVDKEAEITIEINPGTIKKEKFIAYKKANINRISMGLQSTINSELSMLGRIHTYEEFDKNYKLARECGFYNINVDLMFAVPNQTIASYGQSINKICSLKPEHISSYSLIIEEGTNFYNNKDKLILPNEEDERKMYYMTDKILKKNGYERYEISNYCRKGYESRHNSSYWKGIEYLGFGLGASSYIDNTRYKNDSNIDDYIKAHGKVKKYEIQKLSKENLMEEYMFLGLRMIKGVSKQEFVDRFGLNIKDVYKNVLDKYVSMGYIEESNDFLRLTTKGIDVSNVILSEFIL